MQISRTDQSTHIDDWPSYNLILNSTSYANRDPSNNNADGFAAKLTSGVGNVFRGSIAHHNIDDGWDLYTKAGSGAIGAVIIEDSIAYNNGFQLGGTELMGDGNGFKLGGEGIHVPHEIRNSIAFNNGTVGFTSNSNPGVIAHNNIGFNNGKGNIVFTTYNGITPDFTINGFVSFGTSSVPRDQVPSSALLNQNYFHDGSSYKNKAGVAITEANFKSLEVPANFEREENGAIILGDFLSFTAPKLPPRNTDTDSSSVTPSPVGRIELKVEGTVRDGVVDVALTEQQVKEILQATSNGANNKVFINVKADERSNGSVLSLFALTLPSSLLTHPSLQADIAITTPFGGITLSYDVQSTFADKERSDITIQVQWVNNTELATLLNIDGVTRPIISFTLHANGDRLEIDGQPITLAIPYDATQDKDNRHRLSMVYVDDTGSTIPITNAYYDTKSGQVIGKTNHLSSHAIVLAKKSFTDVPDHHWAAEAISVLAAKGIINGINENDFAPAASVTRAQYMTMLVRAFGLTASTNAKATMFHDISSKHYAAEAIAIGEQLGIVNGYPDASFRPAAAITREEMFVMTYRALELVERLKLRAPSSSDLGDQYADGRDVAPYARTAVSALIEEKLISNNVSNKLNPLQVASRAEAAVLIERILSSHYK